MTDFPYDETDVTPTGIFGEPAILEVDIREESPTVRLDADDLKAIRNRIERAQKHSREEIGGEKGQYELCKQTYEGRWITTGEDEEGTDRIVCNHTLANVEIKVASVASADPEFTFQDHPDVPPQVLRQAERGLRRYWQRIDATKVTRSVYRTSKIAPVGICTYEFDETADHIVLREVLPTNFSVDPDAISLDDAEFVVERQVLPFRLVRADPQYRVPSDLKPTYVPKSVGDENAVKRVATGDEEGTENAIALLHYWGRHPDPYTNEQGLLHLVFAETAGGTHDDPLLRERSPYPFDHVPFRTIVNVKRLHEFYGMSDVYLTLDQQRLINHAISAVSTRARRASVDKFVADKTVLNTDDEAISKLKSAKVETLLVDPLGRALGDVVGTIDIPPLRAENLLTYDKAVEADTVVTGVDDYMRGQYPEHKRLATEVRELSRKSGVRSGLDQLVYEEFVADIIEDMFAYMQAVHTGALGIGWKGDTEAEASWEEWSPSNLPEGLRIEVLPGSTSAANTDRDIQRLMMVWNVGQFLFTTGQLDWRPLWRRLINLLDIPEGDAMFATAAAPGMAGPPGMGGMGGMGGMPGMPGMPPMAPGQQPRGPMGPMTPPGPGGPGPVGFPPIPMPQGGI